MKTVNISALHHEKPIHHTDLASYAICHKLSDRIRYRVPALYRSPINCSVILDTLSQKSEIKSVKANSITGSLVIEFRQSLDDDLSFAAELQETLTLLPKLIESSSQSKNHQPSRRNSAAAKSAAPVEVVPEEEAWWCQSIDESIQRLGTDRFRGLSSEEVERRILKFGPNQMEVHEPPSKAELIRRQIMNPQTALLAGSAALSALTGGFFDVIMIGGVIFLNSTIGYISENHAEQVISSIGYLPPQPCRVIRNGKELIVYDQDLVPGDLVILDSGMVPADLRLIYAKRLMVDESALTGESMPVNKSADTVGDGLTPLAERVNMLYRGTIITAGQGIGIVVATGTSTEIGIVRHLVSSTEEQMSPLQKNLETIGRQTVIASSLVCGGVFFIGLLRGMGLTEMLKTSISLAVAAVPEGLPTIGTTTLAIGVQRLERRGILTRRLPVVESLGAVDVICLDKTGTLTLNRMVAKEIHLVEAVYDRPFDDLESMHQSADLRQLIEATVLCNDCYLKADQWMGSATELAFIHLAEDLKLEPRKLQENWPRVKSRYRTDTRQYMVTYHKLHDEDGYYCAVKGSPVQLVEKCSQYLLEGQFYPMTDDIRAKIIAQNEELAGKTLRVLGVAFGRTLDSNGLSLSKLELVWLGLVGLQDPTRAGVKSFIESLHEAHIKTIMLTGDQTATARAIGEELNLNYNHNMKVVDAKELLNRSQEEIDAIIDGVHVFSRVSPTEKLKLVQALQRKGHVVAMTGDGINDSPALKAADVGIAMGKFGSNAARESADLILESDDLQALLEAIKQGRTIRSNLKRSIRFLLATNLSEILLMFFSISLGRGSPLNPAQLLWINLLTDIFPALALALEKPRPSIMKEKPIAPNQDLFDREETKSLIRQGLILTGVSLFNFEYATRRYGNRAQADSQAFFTLTTSQTLYTLTALRESRLHMDDIFSMDPNKRWIQWSMALSLVLIILGVKSNQVSSLLKNQTLDTKDLSVGALSSILSLWLDELQKKVTV